MMLDTLGALTVGGVAAAVLAAIVGSLSNPLPSRLTFATLAGAWIALIAVVSTGGFLERPAGIPVMFATPLIVAAVLAALFPGFRATVGRIPVPVIIGLNVFRVAGLWFVLLALAGRLSGPFPYVAGIGDILTGLGAIPAARIAAAAGANDPRVLAWNAFGFLDLLVAVTLGVVSRTGSPVQVIHAGVGSAAISTLPWSLIPLALVPVFLIGHIVVFAHARSQRAAATQAGTVMTA